AGHVEAVDRDVAGAFQVDPVRRAVVGLSDGNPGVGPEGDRLAGSATGAEVEAGVSAGTDEDGVAGPGGVGGLLQGLPGSQGGPGRSVIAGGGDIEGAEDFTRLERFDPEAGRGAPAKEGVDAGPKTPFDTVQKTETHPHH